MYIVCTKRAVSEITRRVGTHPAKIKLAYSNEGCGCVLSGVAELWIIDQEAEFDHLSPAGAYPMYYDTRHTVFFEDELSVDYTPEKRVFVLKSNNQIYNARMLLHDKRLQHA